MVIKMEELEMFCALHQDIGKAVIVIGECGFERLEEYLALQICRIVLWCFHGPKRIF